MIDAIHGALNDELTQGDVARIRRIFPFQNYMFLAMLFNKLEQSLSETLSLPP